MWIAAAFIAGLAVFPVAIRIPIIVRLGDRVADWLDVVSVNNFR